ncbi:hypothetical protein [Variovorax sp. J31P207]|uniref:hypothetical protein n=1 Tax=Variovorax sp. J31P207 TaxID=3053510 RepID=UPI00257906CA|nr:hypothetical protein [Variovorax sp. J31P207]MDM0068991.1 hypothetical protein [Variovorax sp. J31P207]
MKRFALALAMTAAVAGGATTSLAFNGNGMQGGSPGGVNRAFRTAPGGARVAVVPGRPAFPVHPVFPVRPGFPFHRVVVVGVPVFYGPPPVVVVSGAPALWYCQNPIGYFPTIQACPVGWVQVAQ